jgi:cysteine synthase A
MIECNPSGIAGIANAMELGHEVTLVSADPDFYLAVSPLAKDAYAHPNCQVINSADTFDIPALVALAKRIHAEKKLDGVTTYSEYHTVHTAEVAAALGLPGMSIDGARNARHKHRTRLVLAGTDVPQPRFAHARGASEVAAAAREIGFPCVVKPSDGTASLNVQRLANERELEQYLAELALVTDYGRGVVRIPDVLVEEFIAGEVVSVESCVLTGGEVVNLGITDRVLSGYPHFIEMGLTYFTGHPLQEQLFEMTTRALRGLGIDFGFIHTEFILGQDGPVLCEVNGRLGGLFIPTLMQITSGVDAYLEVIRQALGEQPALPFPGEITAGGQLFGSPVAGRIREIDLSRVPELPGYHAASAYRKPGAAVTKLAKSNFDWIGHVIFTGADPDEVNKRCAAALDRIELSVTVEVAR